MVASNSITLCTTDPNADLSMFKLYAIFKITGYAVWRRVSAGIEGCRKIKGKKVQGGR
jgi:hypothetical protein